MLVVPLYYTSFLILAPALYGQGTLIGQLYTLILGLSVLNHGKKTEAYPGKYYVELLDRAIGHILACVLVWTALKLKDVENARLPLSLFWWSIAYVAYNYHFKRRQILREHAGAIDLQERLIRHHGIFHFVSVFGGMCVLYAVKTCST